jgi:hypothetical protein
MIGTGRQILEAPVSQSHADDSDPLLEFWSERAAALPGKSEPTVAVQPVATPLDTVEPEPPPPQSILIETLIARLDRLESALDNSNAQVSTLKSEVATLVRTIGDIKKQSRRQATIRNVVGMPGRARAPRIASAILAAAVGLSGGVFGWIYFTSPVDSWVAGSLPKPARVQEAPFVPADQPVAPPDSALLPTPSVGPVAVAARAPASNSRVFIGTLSIDAEPGGEVFLNRKSVGHTPLRLTNLKAGSHLIWVERDGYQRWTRVVQVPADRVTRLIADLEPVAER